MGRLVTLAVVSAVVVIGVAAAVDALRGGEPEAREPPPPPETTAPTTTERTAGEATGEGGLEESVEGVLYYTDVNCRLRALRLPGLRALDVRRWNECRFALSPDGTRVSHPRSSWDPTGERLVQWGDGRIEIGDVSFSGHAPAWTPDGRLTYFDGERVREWPSGETVVSERNLRAALARDRDIAYDEDFVRNFRVEETAWLSETRVAAILSVDVANRPREELLAVYNGLRIAAVVPRLGEMHHDLRVSPRRGYFAVRTGNRGGFLLFDRDGSTVPTPNVSGYRAIAWSPDDRWAALATEASVYVFRPGRLDAEVRRLPFGANDLAWRDPDRPLPLPGRVEVRALLEGAGAAGTLYVGDERCRLWALALPAVEWMLEPDGLRGPCRFTVDAGGTLRADDAALHPRRPLTALCHGDVLDVFGPSGALSRIAGACAPAWRPDGTLTYVRGGELWGSTDLQDAHVLLTREKVEEGLGQGARLVSVAHFDNAQFAAAVRRRDQVVLAVFYRGQLVRPPRFSSALIDGLRASPLGMVAARTAEGITFFSVGGDEILTVRGGWAFTWSPGGSVAAVARPRRIAFVLPIERDIVEAAFRATDLAWRPE